MSELTHYLMLNKDRSWVPCYLKSEADRYIQELEMDRDSYKVTYEDYRRRVKTQGQLLSIELKKSRHSNYKRCLAMALWCSAELGMLVSTWESKIKYYKRWQKRWLELAEKFKEAK